MLRIDPGQDGRLWSDVRRPRSAGRNRRGRHLPCYQRFRYRSHRPIGETTSKWVEILLASVEQGRAALLPRNVGDSPFPRGAWHRRRLWASSQLQSSTAHRNGVLLARGKRARLSLPADWLDPLL